MQVVRNADQSSLLMTVKKWSFTIFAFCYFLVWAFCMTLVGFILLTLGGTTHKHKLLYHRMLQRQARFAINHVPGTSFQFDNPSGENFHKPAMIVCNHQSHLDLIAIMMLAPNLIILTKNWVWHNPFYGIIIRYADYLPVSEGEYMIPKLKEMMDKGYSIMIFPEGTRSADCRILRFHRGAFYIAEKLGLDIIPVKIAGFGKVLPKKSWHLHPGQMSVTVLSRIERVTSDSMLGYREMARRVRNLYLS